ncbi:MAG TPA: hypothetical protein VGG33_14260, partial [Polyangia bacterium]
MVTGSLVARRRRGHAPSVWRFAVLAALGATLAAGPGVVHAADGGASVAEIPADAPTATARLDRTEGRIGDRIALTVTTIAPAGVPTNLPT